MKTRLHLFVLFCTFLCSVTGYSQLTYTNNFNANANGWNSGTFGRINYLACEGYSLYGNFYYYDYPDFGFADDVDEEVISASLGTSNGQLATLSYTYKLLNYNTEEAQQNSPDWGSFSVYWGTSPTGPWTLLHTVDPTNHLVSDVCVAKTATFTPANGSQVYLRVYGDNENIDLTDVRLYIDDLSLTQTMLSCNGAPPAAAAVSSKGFACNTESFTLSLNPGTTSSGITHQWQSSTDNVTYTNIATATSTTYTTTQTATTWYRAIITCTASAASTTTAPVRVFNSGAICYCKDIVFAFDVEPITNVTFAGINNTSSAALGSTDYIQDFTGLPAGSVTSGQSYPISVKGNTGSSEFTQYTNSFKAYIDFNHNGSLSDPGEGFELGYLVGSNGVDGMQVTGNIAIPGSALTGPTLLRIVKHYVYEDMETPEYLATTCAADETTGYGQIEDYLLNIQPCTTLPPVADANQSLCTGATLANIAATGTGIKWYAAATGGTALGANAALVSGTTYYATATSGCESLTRTAVTVTINNAVADDPADVTTCDSYTLPALTNGNYYTEAGGLGTMLAAGEVISADTIIYVYTLAGTCSAENSFTVTIETFDVDQLDDVTVCSEYILPELTSGNYYTGASGLGEALSAGDAITETMTLHIYGASAVNPACIAETSFTVTVIAVEADELDDVETCSEYILPALSPANGYYTEPNAGGIQLAEGDEIEENMTIYIHAEVGDAFVCTDESSFTVTIAEVEEPVVDEEIVYELDLSGGFFLNQVEVEAEGTLTWYATEEDAENGVNPIPSDTLIPVGTTTYYVTQTVDGCESDPSEVTISVVLGTEGFDMAAFSYYPNPVSDVLNLSYSENITAVEVLNLVGQKVMSAQFDNDKVQLNLSQLASGTYLVKVNTENASKTIKVVKNK